MATTRYLVVVYVVTAGLHDGDDLGSDEEEILLFTWLVIDITNCKVVAVHCKPVKPRRSDVNDNTLSDVARKTFGLTEEGIKTGQPLESVLDELDQFAKGKLHSESGRSFQVVTDGQHHLRQVLHPEAVSKNITLPPYFSTFYDLRKEFRTFYRSNQDVSNIQQMLDYLCIEADGSAECAIRKVQNMAKIITRLINDGHKFEEPEEIHERLEPGVCNKSEVVDGNTIVRARGLPWQSSDQDVAKFFRGLNIVKGGVALCLSAQGRRNGEALIRFVSSEHREMALKRHKHHIGQRYIEVYRANGEDFINVAGGTNNEAQTFLSRGGQVIVRMRGLPYDCTAQQVIEFFSSGKGTPCDVMHGEEGVLFVRKSDGRATGDAFVLFETEEVAQKALQKHREIIGSRYIELFRSSTAEVQQVLNRSNNPMDSRLNQLNSTFHAPYPMLTGVGSSSDTGSGQVNGSQHQAPVPAAGIVPHQALAPQLPPLLPQPLMTSGSRKDCIRLRGLPYEAQVEQILEFLLDSAKNIVFQGVHMVYNSQGQPSGEAFIQMDSEQSAATASAQRHHKYMTFGKKQRYIEVFQCSIDDMNLVLTGGLPVQRPMISPGGIHPYTFPYLPGQILPPMTSALTSALNPVSRPGLYHPVLYWPYPSPPVSPTTYYGP